MGIFATHLRKTLWTGLLLAVLLITGCAGITPYDPPDYREEPPGRGLFTGAEGEFVIFRKSEEPETGNEVDKRSDEAAEGEQQKMSSEEKKAKIKSGEQQP